MKRIFLVLFIGIFMIGLASAGDLVYDLGNDTTDTGSNNIGGGATYTTFAINTSINATLDVVKIYVTTVVGDTGNINVTIMHSNQSSYGNGTLLDNNAYTNQIAASTMTANNYYNFTFSGVKPQLTAGIEYVLVFSVSNNSAANYIRLGESGAASGKGHQGNSLGSITANGAALVKMNIKLYGYYLYYINLSSPSDISTQANTSLIFNSSLFSSDDLVNATLLLYNSMGIFNRTTIVVNGTSNFTAFNVSGFTIDNYKWNVLACSATTCAIAPSNYTFFWGVNLNNHTYNSSTYETSTESFITNVTTATAIGSATFYYNGTAYAGSVISTGGSDYRLSRTIDVNTITGASATKNWFWSLNLAGININLTTNTQVVGAINLSICGAAPQNIKYYNITFKNETTEEERINASFSSTWNYYLGSGGVNKTLTYSNAIENREYAFCFSPQNKSVNAASTINYYNAESPQRTYSLVSSLLTNSSSSKTLYLLPLISGIYSRYKTISASDNVVVGALAVVTRLLNGNIISIASGVTDSAGQIAFFLNPDMSYDYIFSKAGVGSNSFSLIPNSVETYTVTLGSGSTGISNGTQIFNNLAYSMKPSNDTLLNQTAYTFSLTANSSTAITFMSMNITNSSGYQLLYVSTTAEGTISGILNTGLNKTFIGYFRIDSGSESIEFSKLWVIGEEYEGEYSLFRQLKLFDAYGFSNFIRILLALSCIVLIMIFLSKGEVLDTSESKIAVIVLLVWAFSLIGWLNTGITIGHFSSQYGIARITSAVGLAIIFRKVFT